MKIAYEHLIKFIPSRPSIENISEKFFQLGHEHEIQNNIFDMELTPNRGDCLSINGLLRDLSVFYEVTPNNEIYTDDIKSLDINFVNNSPEACPSISFLKINIQGEISAYKGIFQDYFDDLDVNKNNFFTDISNYISYETGQPTHCYDAEKVTSLISLETTIEKYEFKTLLDKTIKLEDKNLVFVQNDEVINLAGVMGGSSTACSKDTKSVIVECAYFNPENVIGQSIKYDIKSDAAHKFERGVDPLCHEKVLRRFLKIVDEHATIKNIEIFKRDYISHNSTEIPFSIERINNILGLSYNSEEIEDYLTKLGFNIDNNKIVAPSYRSDIKTENDIAEEVARVIGYNNIPTQHIKIPKLSSTPAKNLELLEQNIKSLLTSEGFFEVINDPFVNHETNNSIKLDNPLDSRRKNLRINLEKSLIDNLLYNERRQQDSIKLFEITDVYYLEKKQLKNKRKLGIICSGRVGKNYIDFSKKIDNKYLTNILDKFSKKISFNPHLINRDELETKLNNKIIYLEIDLNELENYDLETSNKEKLTLNKNNFKKYIPISSFPSSVRDLSFAVADKEKYLDLQNLLLDYKDVLIKEIFIFDFYHNENKDEIKIGFRFVFQSNSSTITETDVNNIMNEIIEKALSIPSVEIPGLKR
jgi:phenylalanyl-tRNA synthetase beta chain